MAKLNVMQEETGGIAHREAGLRCWAMYGASICPMCRGSGIVASPSWRDQARKGGLKSYLTSLRQGSLSMKERGRLGGRPRALTIRKLRERREAAPKCIDVAFYLVWRKRHPPTELLHLHGEGLPCYFGVRLNNVARHSSPGELDTASTAPVTSHRHYLLCNRQFALILPNQKPDILCFTPR